MVDPVLSGLCGFIEKSPSSYHAVRELKLRLDAAGFEELRETGRWELRPGKNYYVIRNGSSIISFKLPAGAVGGFHIVASHSDSPCFKLKPDPVLKMESAPARLNVEAYGGMIRSTWFDRPLSVAGRVLVEDEGRLSQRLVYFDRDLLMIPSLAIHLSRDVKKDGPVSVQSELLPLIGDGVDGEAWMALLRKELGIGGAGILGADLFLVCRMRPTIWGAQGEYLAAPRLDDLACCYTSFEGFLTAEASGHIAMHCVFDNEEVGSRSMQGAESTFLRTVTERICRALGMDEEAYDAAVAASCMMSADNAHAFHPNYGGKYDSVNRPKMNGGVVLKHQAGQRYTTDAVSEAIFKRICLSGGIPYQEYANHSDVPGGSTLGNISNTQLSVRSADIGLAQLAMHSAYETMGSTDAAYMTRFAEAFYREPLPEVET